MKFLYHIHYNDGRENENWIATFATKEDARKFLENNADKNIVLIPQKVQA